MTRRLYVAPKKEKGARRKKKKTRGQGEKTNVRTVQLLDNGEKKKKNLNEGAEETGKQGIPPVKRSGGPREKGKFNLTPHSQVVVDHGRGI